MGMRGVVKSTVGEVAIMEIDGKPLVVFMIYKEQYYHYRTQESL